MSDRSPKPGLVAPSEALPPDTTVPLALGGARGHALRRSLDSILAQVEAMLVLHDENLGFPAEGWLRGVRSHLWVAQDLLLGIVPAPGEDE